MSYENPFETPSHDPRNDEGFLLEPRSAKHSVLGMLSLGIAVLAGLMEFALIVAAGVMAAQAGGDLDPESPALIMLGLGILAGFPLCLLGLGLGIGGLAESGRSKVFPVLGMVFNLLVLLGVGGVMVIGMVAG